MKREEIITLIVLFELGRLSGIFQPTKNKSAVCVISDDICKQCLCSNLTTGNTTQYVINCRNNKQTEIPRDLPNNTICLDLSDNHIKHIGIDTFNGDCFSSLTCLSLSNNKLTNIHCDLFKGLGSLKMLDLSLNKIRYYDIAKTAFSSLATNLIYLDIKQNLSNQHENETYPDEAISKLKNLKTLVIDGLNAQHLDQGFSELTELQEIFFSGHYGRCNITKMDFAFFKNIKASQNFRLFIHNCSLENIGNGTFRSLKNLTTLDLSWNLNLTLKSLPNITHGLKNTNISYLNLNSLYKFYLNDECVKLQDDYISDLQHTNLTILTLESNNIIGVTNEFIDVWPRSIQYVSFRDNLFILGDYLQRLTDNHTLYNLRYLDVSKQFSQHTPPNWRAEGSLENLNDKIEDSTHVGKCTSQECENCGHNTIGNDTYLNKLCQYMFKRIREECYFEKILSKVARLQPLKQSRREMTPTSLTYNSAKTVFSTDCSKLEYLDVSNNQPIYIMTPLIYLKKMPDLALLNISNDYLGLDLEHDTSFQEYMKLPTIKVLDLSGNGISYINQTTFENLTHLKQLYLSGNRLKQTLYLNNMKELNYLDLKGNIIETLPKLIRDTMDQLNNFTINIADNNIKCNCSNLDFLHWMDSRMTSGKIHFEEYDKYECTFDDGTKQKINGTHAISDLKNKCSKQTFYVPILILSLCLLTFFLIVSVGLAYRYRWNLRYLYFTTKMNLIHGYQPVRNDDTEFEKDVFVSYADEDRGFVREHILPELGERGNISLLVHDRDFTAGNYVSDNIMNAITTTRKTLIVLTKYYLKRKWCLYEFNMAKQEGIETGRSVLCVIMKEEIPLEDIPLGIMEIIKKRTYIEYPQETVHLEGFWERLTRAIKS